MANIDQIVTGEYAISEIDKAEGRKYSLVR